MKKLIEKVAAMLGLYSATLKKEETQVKRVLANLDTSDPRKRAINKWDREFLDLVPVLYKYDDALVFVNRFGYVCEIYFASLRCEDVANVAFQRKLCSVWQNDLNCEYYIKYRNLLHFFLDRWDFDEGLKQELMADPSKVEVLIIYNKFAEAKGRKIL